MRVGMAWGCFDLFHAGHRYFLTCAYDHCDYLIVAVNSDESVKRLKGPSRPVHNMQTRLHNVHQYADAAIPFDGYECGLIVHIKPAVILRGYDHSIDVTLGTPQVANGIGCAIVQIAQLPGYSTSRVLNEAKFDA